MIAVVFFLSFRVALFSSFIFNNENFKFINILEYDLETFYNFLKEVFIMFERTVFAY